MAKDPIGKILVVDDELDLLEVFKLELEANGFEVYTASNGLEALDLFDQHKFDIVLTDVVMPFMDGSGFLKKLRDIAANSRTYVYAISGYTVYTEEQLKQLGATALISKPFDYGQLIDTLKATVEMIREVERVTKAS